MQIQINFGDVQSSPALQNHVEETVNASMKQWTDRITRVEIHLHDDNGPKAGNDKKCIVEVRLAGLQPMAVNAIADDLYKAIDFACDKAQRAVRHKLERQDELRRVAG